MKKILKKKPAKNPIKRPVKKPVQKTNTRKKRSSKRFKKYFSLFKVLVFATIIAAIGIGLMDLKTVKKIQNSMALGISNVKSYASIEKIEEMYQQLIGGESKPVQAEKKDRKMEKRAERQKKSVKTVYESEPEERGYYEEEETEKGTPGERAVKNIAKKVLKREAERALGSHIGAGNAKFLSDIFESTMEEE